MCACQDSSVSQVNSASYFQGHCTCIFIHSKLSKAQFKIEVLCGIYRAPLIRHPLTSEWQINEDAPDGCAEFLMMIFHCQGFYYVAFEQSGGNSLRFLVLAGISSSVGLSPFRHRLDSDLDNYPRVLISPLTCRLPWATPPRSLFCGSPSLYSGLGVGQ